MGYCGPSRYGHEEAESKGYEEEDEVETPQGVDLTEKNKAETAQNNAGRDQKPAPISINDKSDQGGRYSALDAPERGGKGSGGIGPAEFVYNRIKKGRKTVIKGSGAAERI